MSTHSCMECEQQTTGEGTRNVLDSFDNEGQEAAMNGSW